MRPSRRRRTATHTQFPIWLARAADAPAFGRLLRAFNVGFGESTSPAEVIAERPLGQTAGVGEQFLDHVPGVQSPSEAETGEACLGDIRLQGFCERDQSLPERPAAGACPGAVVEPKPGPEGVAAVAEEECPG